MTDYSDYYRTKARYEGRTPQNKPIPGSEQVKNNAGGYVFAITPWERLRRFLVIGSLGGSYYVNERELTVDNAKAIEDLIAEDGERVVDEIVSISVAGRAPSNDPALYTLAMCAGLGDEKTRKYALEHLHLVARIGTHLFHFVKYAKAFRGLSGRAFRSAISHWYNDKEPIRAAYQMLKYQSRDGWSHRDVLRMVHPRPKNEEVNILFDWAINGWHWEAPPPLYPAAGKTMSQIAAVEFLKRYPTPYGAVRAILDHRLTREMIPSELLKSKEVWDALLRQMPMGAMVRNLGNMSKCGLLESMSEAEQIVNLRLHDEERIRNSRLHPLSLLVAQKTYESGGGYRGSGSWNASARVVDALNDAFYLAFGNVEPTNKRIMIALDVSGSMRAEFGKSILTCCEAATALSLVTANVEGSYLITRFHTGIQPIPISPRQRLTDVMRYTDRINYGGTDCSLPMTWAMAERKMFDAFIVITDSETRAGRIHPVQALRQYRQWSNIYAKLIVVGMTSSGFSIADPDDGGMLDVVGFDTATPNLISEFIRMNG